MSKKKYINEMVAIKLNNFKNSCVFKLKDFNFFINWITLVKNV